MGQEEKPNFIKVGGITVEKPDSDGDFEIMITDNNGSEVYRYLTTAEAIYIAGFIMNCTKD